MTLGHLSVLLIAGISAFLSGCSSKSTVEVSMDSVEPFSAYDLSKGEDAHSQAMQYLNLGTRVRVHKANDLDAYADGYYNVAVRTGQGMALAGVLAGAMNPFQAGFTATGLQSNTSKLHYLYTRNFILMITPLPSLDVNDVSLVMADARQHLASVIEDAYRADSSDVFVVDNAAKSGWTRWERTYVIPLSDDGGVADCYYPETLSEIQADVLQNGPSTSYSLPANGSQGCFSEISPYAKIYTSNEGNGWGLPSGNFLVQRAWVPALFPIEHLSSTIDGVYLYQPALKVMKDENVSNYKDNNKLDELKEYFDNKIMFKPLPTVTNLTNGEKLKLGSKA